MAKIKGFLSQDVEVTRKITPDSPFTTEGMPPSWLPLIEKIMRWYDQLIYPVMTPFGQMGARKAKQTRRDNTFLTEVSAAWSALAPAERAEWNDAAIFVKRSGYQLFVKDYCYRKQEGLSLPGTPSLYHQVHGLQMSNPGGLANVRLQRDDIILTGEISLTFNYKKVENAPTGGDPFNFVVTLWYMEGGEIKTETHTWEAPAGNRPWDEVHESYGTAGRKYFHHRIIFYLDDYDADVYFANFLLKDRTISWTVSYDGDVFPDADTPVWTKTGSVSTEKIRGKRLHLAEVADILSSVVYLRVPSFINNIGSSVKWRLKIEKGTAKDAGEDEFTARVVHSDGARRVEYFLYQNGIIFKIGDEYKKYHLDITKYRTFRSFIKDNRLNFDIGRTNVLREILPESAVQEVSFGHYGRDNYDSESRWGFVKYYHGGEEDPGYDILREGWWLLTGEIWEPSTLYRKSGWTFLPEYHVPYFDVVYLG